MVSLSDDSTLIISELPLNSALLSAAAELGYITTTPVQSQVIPAILQKQDLLVSAATGSGKTAAFLLPVLDLLLQAASSATRALILVPTRELAVQVAKNAQQLSKSTTLKIGTITGGEDYKKQHGYLTREFDLIIATPGRLLEHLEQAPEVLQNIEILILDEADRMLDMGFSQPVLQITEACPVQRQTLLFSATLEHPSVQKFAAQLANAPETISLQTVHDQHLAIEQHILPCDDVKHKQTVLTWLLNHETYQKALIFTNSKAQADALQGPLRGKKLRVSVLHGDMDQKIRKKVLSDYREGIIPILISTDIAGRGLDIEGVDLVINFDMPRTAHQYVHRIGRTGRHENEGLAISLINSTEWNLMSGIERYLKQSFIRRTIEEVAGNFKGPKKLKSSGKAAGTKSTKAPAKKETVKKPKQRQRDLKNIGKRRAPSQIGSDTSSTETEDDSNQ